MKKPFVVGFMVMIALSVNGFDNALAEPEPKISVRMNGHSTFYLDSPQKIIRAYVEIQNYTPSDGIYFMKITHISTQKVMEDDKIFPKPSDNDLWAVHIGYPILESSIKQYGQEYLGDFELQIRTEKGSQIASTKFSIYESIESELFDVYVSRSQINSNWTLTEFNDEPFPKIPEWVKNTHIWYSENKISEIEFFDALQYLVQKDIIKLDYLLKNR